jgi:hypothetical protein
VRRFGRAASPLAAGSSPVFRTRGYRTDPAFAVGPPDSMGQVNVSAPARPIRLRAARVLDRSRVRLEFDPAAPVLSPESIEFQPAVRVGSLDTDGENALIVELEPGSIFSAGSYRVTVDPGVQGGEGFTTLTEGNALTFSVTPVVYPNPARGDQDVVRFDWLNNGARVQVFDLGGRPVWSAEADGSGTVFWRLSDSTGGLPAPGVYIYRIDGLSVVTGKLALIR